jgi:proline iminopeptidase
MKLIIDFSVLFLLFHFFVVNLLAWSLWEGRIAKLIQEPVEALSSSFGDDHYALAFARIENHYFINQVFFPRDGFLIEKANIAKIAHIPTVIVQGRYDIVCPAISAHDLHKAMPQSEVHYVLSGHSGFEKEIAQKLVEATDKFKNRK